QRLERLQTRGRPRQEDRGNRADRDPGNHVRGESFFLVEPSRRAAPLQAQGRAGRTRHANLPRVLLPCSKLTPQCNVRKSNLGETTGRHLSSPDSRSLNPFSRAATSTRSACNPAGEACSTPGFRWANPQAGDKPLKPCRVRDPQAA